MEVWVMMTSHERMMCRLEVMHEIAFALRYRASKITAKSLGKSSASPLPNRMREALIDAAFAIESDIREMERDSRAVYL